MQSKTDLYAIFHLNLGFSSIPLKHYPVVLERCYWPLLNWADKGLGRFGIELPSETLDTIDRLDPLWTKKLVELEKAGKVEVIGSGLVQSIFPLVPCEVNQWNLKLGNERYKQVLGKTPVTAYVNEQTFSQSLVEIYQQASFESLVMDWNNALRYLDSKPELQFKSPWVQGANSKIRLLWNGSVAFQRLQRYLQEDIDLEEYMSFLSDQLKRGAGGAFCFYGSDIEILDYKPGDSDAFYGLIPEKKQQSAFERVLEKIRSEGLSWKLPCEVVKDHAVSDVVQLESADYPIPTKKQEKYNVTRWALGGRQNPKLNTLCYRAYEQMQGSSDSELWRKLCLAWASDLRTYTTEEKFLDTQILIGGVLSKASPKKSEHESSFSSKKKSHVPLRSQIAGQQLLLANDSVELRLNTKRGKIHSLKFPDVSSKPLIGTVAQGTFSPIRHAVDYFSGHTIVERAGSFRYTDLDQTKVINPQPRPEEGGWAVTFKHNSPSFILYKTYWVAAQDPEVRLRYHFQFKDLPAASIRFGILTAMPDAFDLNSLWYGTHNGGNQIEKFSLSDAPSFDSGEPVNYAVSSAFCLGATEGIFEFGDQNSVLRVTAQKSQQYSVPLLSFTRFNGKKDFLFRVSHSIGELDDTANTLWRGHVYVDLALHARKA